MSYAGKIRMSLGRLQLFGIILILSYTVDVFGIEPTVLERKSLRIGTETVDEITSTFINGLFGNPISGYPSGIDVKKISGQNYYLTVITDCGWGRIVYLKTNWSDTLAFHNVKAFGNCGSGINAFVFPVGVQIGGYNGEFDPNLDYVYIVDTGNSRIVRLRYDLSTNSLIWNATFGAELHEPEELVYIDNGTSDRSDDEILVCDMYLSKIFRYSASGQYLGAYGMPGRGPGQLFSPLGICAGARGTKWEKDIYITDTYNFKVCHFRREASNLVFVNEKSFDEHPRSKLMGIISDDQGYIYVADSRRNRLLKLGPELEQIAILDENANPEVSFYQPQFLEFYDGVLMVVELYTYQSGFKFFNSKLLDSLKWDEDWSGLDSIYLRSDALVPCGRTLKFGPGTNIFIAPLSDDDNLGIDTGRVEIIVEGTLLSTGMLSDSVLIRSARIPSYKGDWYGIRVTEPCGLVNMHFTSVRNAENALDFYDGTNNTNYISGYIYNSQLEKNATAGIYSDNSILDIENCLLKDNDIYGLLCAKTKADIYSDGFLGNGSYGIYVDLANYVGDSVRIVSSVIDGQGVTQYNGLYLRHPAARVQGCNIKNCNKDAGMLISGNTPKLKLDTLTTKIGVDCSNSASPTLRYCRITPSALQIGVNARSGSFPNLGQSSLDRGNNSIFPTMMSGGYRVVNSNILTSISAKYNWWGTSTPTPSMFSGSVTYSPWLYGEPPPPPKISVPDELPGDFFVSDNYPNPFNPSTRINYSIPSAGMLQVTIYNILGQQIKIIQNGMVNAGFYQLNWDGTNNEGLQVGSGVYLINFQFNDSIETRKVVLLR